MFQRHCFRRFPRDVQLQRLRDGPRHLLVISLMMQATIRRGGDFVGRSWSGDASIASRLLRADQLNKYAQSYRGMWKNSCDFYTHSSYRNVGTTDKITADKPGAVNIRNWGRGNCLSPNLGFATYKYFRIQVQKAALCGLQNKQKCVSGRGSVHNAEFQLG